MKKHLPKHYYKFGKYLHIRYESQDDPDSPRYDTGYPCTGRRTLTNIWRWARNIRRWAIEDTRYTNSNTVRTWNITKSARKNSITDYTWHTKYWNLSKNHWWASPLDKGALPKYEYSPNELYWKKIKEEQIKYYQNKRNT